MKTKTILIVDDTKENVDILLSLLSEYDLLVALNGEKALQMVEKHRVDLILLDIVMPVMDGFEVCEKLKSNTLTSEIPIIFLTVKTDAVSVEKAYDAGGSDYITKPFKPKELLARVKRELQLQAFKTEKQTILIVDDTKENIDILLSLLSEYDLLVALNGEKALQMLEKHPVDLILLDIVMPVMDGFEVCQKLKADPSTEEVPVIFLTAKTDETSIEKAYDIGGGDYVTKPFKPKELLARVKRELQLQEVQNELKLLASTDPLTKLYNRRYFSEISTHVFNLSQRDNYPLGIIMLDIDRFKNINDTYGHKVGDVVIMQLADLLRSHQRKSDIISRFGGEEFALLLPNTSLEGATVVSEKIRKDVEASRVDANSGVIVKYTVSLGVSEVDIQQETSIEKALIRADNALYAAKRAGRNKVCAKK